MCFAWYPSVTQAWAVRRLNMGHIGSNSRRIPLLLVPRAYCVFKHTPCQMQLRTGVEQVSTSTAVEYGSADREPSGKFTEQPKLQ